MNLAARIVNADTHLITAAMPYELCFSRARKSAI